MQQKLENFFIHKPVSPSSFSKTRKTCFIYDPVSFRAYFDYYSDELVNTHEFITTCVVKKSVAVSSDNPNIENTSPLQQIKIKLYYKKCHALVPDFQKIQTKADTPLLKSNLQKAVRRQNTSVAVQTTIVLMQKDPVELVRRLGIIEIEDVCLFDHYPILLWLTMAGNQYILKTRDQYILLCIVVALCECGKYYEERYISDTIIKHELIENMEMGDVYLSLMYRTQYGGMGGDIQMLKCSLVHYVNTGGVEKTCWDNLEDSLEKITMNECEILLEAIDFHPYPTMLHYIGKQISTPLNIVKEVIWNGESAYNKRKPHIIKKMEATRESVIWKRTKPVADTFRHMVLQQIYG
jgi:hypothetical protein